MKIDSGGTAWHLDLYMTDHTMFRQMNAWPIDLRLPWDYQSKIRMGWLHNYITAWHPNPYMTNHTMCRYMKTGLSSLRLPWNYQSKIHMGECMHDLFDSTRPHYQSSYACMAFLFLSALVLHCQLSYICLAPFTRQHSNLSLNNLC